MSAIRSMTGFARVSQAWGKGEISVTVKSVNHRGLDLHFHNGPEIDPFENAMRSAIKCAIERGHVDVRVGFTGDSDGDAGLNEAMLARYMGAYRKAAGLYGLGEAEPDLNAALRIPGMLGGASEALRVEGLEPGVLSALEQALRSLNAFREREGAELAKIIREHNDAIGQRCSEMQQIRQSALPAFQQRLTDRLRELLRGSAVDPQRITQEAAMLSDRSDIGEECARLEIHSRQVEELLSGGGEIGKKMDFLLQEMNRETNTILSKTNGIGELGLRITDLALATKADIEKIREQALNLE